MADHPSGRSEAEVVVAVDTATPDTVVGAVDFGGGAPRVLHAAVVSPAEGRPRHTASALTELDRAGAAAGGWGIVERIGVGIGPGSFTGLRVGIATARGIALARGVTLVGVDTLAALALGGMPADTGAAPAATDPLVLAVVDARRGELFCALWETPSGPADRGRPEERWPPAVLSRDALADRLATLGRPPLAVGDGALVARQTLEHAGCEVPGEDDRRHHLDPVVTCRLARQAPVGPLDAVEPRYLRRPDAARWQERDTGRRPDRAG